MSNVFAEMSDLRDEQVLDEMSQRGFALYNERLKSVLEPEFNGQIVAVHMNSGEYAVARTAGEALRTLRLRLPQGIVMTMDIGPVAEDDLLTLRMRGGQMATNRPK